MKRKLILTASLLTAFALSLPLVSADETNNSSQVSSTTETVSTSSSIATSESSSLAPASSTAEASIKSATSSTATSETIRELEGQDDSSYGKFIKGTTVTAEEFKPIIEAIESFKINSIAFYDKAPAMETSGLTKAVFLIVTDKDETLKYTYTFLTKNNEATIKVSDIKFEAEKNLLSFKTDPSSVAYVTADIDKATAEIYTHEDGIVARQYEKTPSTIQIVVLDLKGNYSDVIDFDVPANDVSKNEAEPEKLTNLQDIAEKVKNDRDKLPQTGEAIAKYGLAGGGILVIAVGLILYKRRK